MWPTSVIFADPRTNFIFKRIFNTEERKHLLIGLLDALLQLDEAHRIVEVQRLRDDQRPAISELGQSILDVRCTDATGEQYVVKLQLFRVEEFEKHAVYNVAKTCARGGVAGADHPMPNDVVGVTICDFTMWPERDERGAFRIPMLSLWRTQEEHRGTPSLPQRRFVFLELPKYTASSAARTLVEKWAYFFREANNCDAIPAVLARPPFLEAFEAARLVHFTIGEWNTYDWAKVAEQDARGALTMAKRLGRTEGRLEGLQQGRVLEKRAMLEKLLLAKGLSEAHRARISSCEDAAILDGWIGCAISGVAPPELFGT